MEEMNQKISLREDLKRYYSGLLRHPGVMLVTLSVSMAIIISSYNGTIEVQIATSEGYVPVANIVVAIISNIVFWSSILIGMALIFTIKRAIQMRRSF